MPQHQQRSPPICNGVNAQGFEGVALGATFVKAQYSTVKYVVLALLFGAAALMENHAPVNSCDGWKGLPCMCHTVAQMFKFCIGCIIDDVLQS